MVQERRLATTKSPPFINGIVGRGDYIWKWPTNIWKRNPHLMRWYYTGRKGYKTYTDKNTQENLSKTKLQGKNSKQDDFPT